MLHQLSKLNTLHHNRKLIFFPILHYLLFEKNILDMRQHSFQYMILNILYHERDYKSHQVSSIQRLRFAPPLFNLLNDNNLSL